MEILNLNKPDQKQLDYWEERIGGGDGNLWLFVHPYYGQGKEEYMSKKLINYPESVIGFEGVMADTAKPLMVLESYLHEEMERLKFRNEFCGGDRILVVETSPSHPTPVNYAPGGNWVDSERAAWERLGEILHMVGVRRLVLGGGFLDEESICGRGGVISMMPCACVGVTAINLGAYFSVEFSAFTYPLVRAGLMYRPTGGTWA